MFHRRYLRFGLRPMFVVLTILSVWLGVRVNRARKVHNAVETVTELGGDYWFAEPFNVGSASMCWGLGGKAYLAYSSVSATKVAHEDPFNMAMIADLGDSASAVGLGVAVGPRLKSEGGHFGGGIDLYMTVHAGSFDFGLWGSDSGSTISGANIFGTYSF